METENEPGMVRPWLLVVLVVVVLAGIGFFTWNHYQSKKVASQSVVTDNTVIATPTPDTGIVVPTPVATTSVITPTLVPIKTTISTPTPTPVPSLNKFDGIVSYGYSTSSTDSPYYHQTCSSNVSFNYSSESKISTDPYASGSYGITILDNSGNKTFVHCQLIEPQTVDKYFQQQKSFDTNLQKKLINGYQVLISQGSTGKYATIINGSDITLTNAMVVSSDSVSSTDFDLVLNSLKFK